MTTKRGWHDFVANLFRWEEHRKSKSEHLITGLACGMFMVIEATVVVVMLVSIFIYSWAALQIVVFSLGICALLALMMWFMIAYRFGYGKPSSVIKNRSFKWGAIVGIILMIIIMIVGAAGLWSSPPTP